MKDFEIKFNRSIILIIFLIIALGIFYSLDIGDKFRYPDEQQYYQLAKNLASQFHYSLSGESPTAYRPPGYPVLLSFFILIGADIFHLRILNFIFLSLSIVLLVKIIRALYSPRAAAIGAFLVIAYPILFYTSSTLSPQIFASFLFLLFLFQLTTKLPSNSLYFLMGVTYAILILTVPIFLLLLPVITIWCVSSKKTIKFKQLIIFSMTLFILVGSWTLRNYLTFNSLVLVSSNAGENLLYGNSENTLPNTGPVNISKYTQETLEMNEGERNTYYISQAIYFMVDNPLRTFTLYFQKFLNYFNYTNILKTVSEASYQKDLLMLVTYGTLIILLFVRIFLFLWYKFSSFESLLLLLYIASGLTYAIFFTRIRFRLPFDFLLIAIVAIFLDHVIDTWQQKHLNNESNLH